MSGQFRFLNSLKIPRPSFGLLMILMGLMVPLLIAACGGDDPTAIPQAAAPTAQPSPTAVAPEPTAMAPEPTAIAPEPTATSPEPTATPPPTGLPDITIEVSSQGSLGPHLVDSDGMTLYLFTKDKRNASACAGPCANKWPILMSGAAPVAGEGVNADRLATIERADGSSQVSYNGKPLYYFVDDKNPGDTLGQDSVDKWFLVSPDGGPIRTTASLSATENGAFGTILTDESGNSLYLFTKDESNTSNCSGGCALAWPPLLTGDDPVAGEGLAESRIGSISRGNGVKQVTYNSKPLYYFASDGKPGDTMGQDRGGVWFVVTTDGGALYNNAPVKLSANDELGTILTDASGRSLYLFAKDEPNVSNCSGGCALAWPPLITVNGPAAGDSLSAAHLGTTKRADGSNQVTYDGSPLYYFAKDEKPGDTSGQGIGSVWFVINNFTITIALDELNGSGQTGSVKLTVNGDQTELALSATRGISALAHIHQGSCQSLGGVVHGLSDTSGSSSSTTVDATLDSLISGSFSVNLHTDGNPGLYSSCGDIAVDAQSLTITLDELNDSGQTGWATLTDLGQKTQVVVAATSGISALAHIHNGGCDTLGGVVHGLSDTSGDTSSMVVDANLADLTAGSFAVNLHTDGNPGLYSSCGNVATTGQSLTIALGELNGSGQSGWATLTAMGAQTQVVVSATAGISALAHIHNGGCDTLGGVVHGLSDTSGSTSSSVVDATLDALIVGSFAVNLHTDGNPGLYSSCGNVATTGQSLTIALGELNDSGQSGWATLTAMGDQTQVEISATAGISALAHIHNGGCDTLGGVVHGLSDTTGATSSTVVDATLDSLTVGSFAVNLHTDGNAGVYSSCGNIGVEGKSVTIALGELNGSGQSGWATLTAMGDQTQVEISATAGISALAHIHEGTCATLGGVVYGLSDTSGASSSSTVDVTLDALKSGSFAVNLHTDGDPGLYSACGDI